MVFWEKKESENIWESELTNGKEYSNITVLSDNTVM